jgi:hypothetical protein
MAMLEGTCVVLFAFDVGFQIDLGRAGVLLAGAMPRGLKRVGKPSPGWFDFDPLPLRTVMEAQVMSVGGLQTDGQAEIVVYDFGAVVVSLRMGLAVEPSALPALGEHLLSDRQLLNEARRAAERLLRSIEPAVEKPNLRDMYEDYVVFSIERWPEGMTPEAIVEAHGALIAQAVEGETDALSASEMARTLEARLSYGLEDLAVINWNGALLLDREPGDVLSLLAHANVELLELRVLDAELDAILERADETLGVVTRRRWWPVLLEPRLLREFATVQTDAAVMFEGVNNAIKLLGNQYLARVYRVAALRLDLGSWHASLRRRTVCTRSCPIRSRSGAWRCWRSSSLCSLRCRWCCRFCRSASTESRWHRMHDHAMVPSRCNTVWHWRVCPLDILAPGGVGVLSQRERTGASLYVARECGHGALHISVRGVA